MRLYPLPDLQTLELVKNCDAIIESGCDKCMGKCLAHREGKGVMKSDSHLKLKESCLGIVLILESNNRVESKVTPEISWM